MCPPIGGMAAFLFALTSGAVDGISDVVANSAVLVAVRTGSAALDDS